MSKGIILWKVPVKKEKPANNRLNQILEQAEMDEGGDLVHKLKFIALATMEVLIQAELNAQVEEYGRI